MTNKCISISMTDACSMFKLKKENGYPSRVDFNRLRLRLAELTPNAEEAKYMYFFTNKMMDNENPIDIAQKHQTFIDCINRVGWESCEVNPGEFMVFRVATATESITNPSQSEYARKNYNVSMTVKSLYQESSVAIMTLQSQLDEYYFGEGWEDYDIVVNLILFNDNYNFALKKLLEFYPHITINIITTESRLQFFSTEFENIKQVSIYEFNSVLNSNEQALMESFI